MRDIVRALAALVLTSCVGHGDFYWVHLDPAFTPDQAGKVLDAMQAWELAVPVSLAPDVRTCSGAHNSEICIHASNHAELMARDVPSPGQSSNPLGLTAGGINSNGAEIYIDVPGIEGTQYAANFTQIVEHELGHAMGLKHMTPGHLMAPFIEDMADGPTCGDVQQWQEVRGTIIHCPAPHE